MNGGAFGRLHRDGFIHCEHTISSRRWVRHALLPRREIAQCAPRRLLRIDS
jgi:hypothetical protein